MDTLVQKLVRGSAEINRMESEILLIIGMIKSMLPKNPEKERLNTHEPKVYPRYFLHRFPKNGKEGLYWEIAFVYGDYGYAMVRCYRSEPYYADDGRHTLLSGTRSEMRYKDIIAIHNDLNRFVTFAVEAFPELNEKLAPFIEVANA